jgi:leucyl aminopeptidase
MTNQRKILFDKMKLTNLDKIQAVLVICLNESLKLSKYANQLNSLTGGLIERYKKSLVFLEQKENSCFTLNFPTGLRADAIIVIKTSKICDVLGARASGASLSKMLGSRKAVASFCDHPYQNEIIFGFGMMDYKFSHHKSVSKNGEHSLKIFVENPDLSQKNYEVFQAINAGIYFARDLTNEPSNILTTQEFSKRIKTLQKYGLIIHTLEEKDLKKLGMNALLGVGLGSPSPTKVMIMEWRGAGDAKPLALVGKGVVFDTGGISLKSPTGMEQMTVDMGGAGVVVGLMKTLALRKAKANVVGLVGIVENMPDGKAQRPGDVVKSMKGDTIEIINTDAEGRLVLCDVMWYAQKHYKPAALIDLATLTGAIIVSLGHDKAGVFSNCSDFYEKFIFSAVKEDEGAWRMPLDDNYDKLLKSNIADMKNVGGRAANAITAAQFLQRFIEDDMPWIHLDIAGVASTEYETKYAPKGASGWGVRTLNRLVNDYYEIM